MTSRIARAHGGDLTAASPQQAPVALSQAKGLNLPPAGTITWSIARSTTLAYGPGQS
jgi:hypothetical protein